KSDVILKDDKTYYELEFSDKGLVAFPVTLTEPYVLSTVDKRIENVDDFKQTLTFKGAGRIHDIVANELNVTAVSMSRSETYEALSRGSLDGIIYTLADWKPSGFDELLRNTLTGMYLGHGASHLAMKEETWSKLSEETQQKFE